MKISVSIPLKSFLLGARGLALILLLCAAAEVSLAQSIDISYPSPIRTNEVVGTIAARDLGDSRLTDHFYAFTGTPGDVLVTVKSNNLNGDVDLFTAGSLRPLMKFTIYAENSSPATRAIFLRKREDLILRVQARSPNDDEGMYHIKLGGSFQPIAGDDPLAETPSPATDPSTSASRSTGSRRVSSVGARIPEPPVVREEVATAPTPEPTPDDVAVPTATPEATPRTETPAPAPAPRRVRGRVPPGRRKPTAPQPTRKNESSGSETTSEPDAAEATTNADPAPPTRRTGRRGAINRPTEQIPVPEPQTGPRLVIQMQDGTLIERFMSTIRRVTVEKNQIVVVRNDGMIERTRMSDVLRMAIEP
ncbi:MAG: hypothetical protein ND866_05115 [Pyrinomonadaceae bacterium]|nr:hypothetical protein [Pyrinomonadaceae bacterium]